MADTDPPVSQGNVFASLSTEEDSTGPEKKVQPETQDKKQTDGNKESSGAKRTPAKATSRWRSGGKAAEKFSKAKFQYTREELLQLYTKTPDYPSDFEASSVTSDESLVPVNLSSKLLEEFQSLQKKYTYNITPSRQRGRGRAPRGRESARGRRGKRPESLEKDSKHSDSSSEESESSETSEEEEEGEEDGNDTQTVFVDTSWFYKDPQGVVQGPFSSTQMNEWYTENFFPRDLPIRQEDQEGFVPLQKFPGNPFARTGKKPQSKRTESGGAGEPGTGNRDKASGNRMAAPKKAQDDEENEKKKKEEGGEEGKKGGRGGEEEEAAPKENVKAGVVSAETVEPAGATEEGTVDADPAGATPSDQIAQQNKPKEAAPVKVEPGRAPPSDASRMWTAEDLERRQFEQYRARGSGVPPHAGPSAVAQPSPHTMRGGPTMERRQGVYDMAAIEQQMMGGSRVPHAVAHPSPWGMPPGAPPSGARGVSLPAIQEQERMARSIAGVGRGAFGRGHPHPGRGGGTGLGPMGRRPQPSMGPRGPAPRGPPVHAWGLPFRGGAPFNLREFEHAMDPRALHAMMAMGRDQHHHHHQHQYHHGHHHHHHHHQQQHHHGHHQAKASTLHINHGNDTAASEDGHQKTAEPSKEAEQQSVLEGGNSSTGKEQHVPTPEDERSPWAVPAVSSVPIPRAMEQAQASSAERSRSESKKEQSREGGGEQDRLSFLFKSWGISAENMPEGQPGWGMRVPETAKMLSVTEIEQMEAQSRKDQSRTNNNNNAKEGKPEPRERPSCGPGTSAPSSSRSRPNPRKKSNKKNAKKPAEEASPHAVAPWATSATAAPKRTLQEIQKEEQILQARRKKEMAALAKQQAAMAQQQSRWSPWGGATQGPALATSNTLRDIQEQQRKEHEAEQRRRREQKERQEAEARARGPPPMWGPAPTAKETKSFSEIIAQQTREKAALEHSRPKKPKASAPGGIAGWGAPAQARKKSLREIQEEQARAAKAKAAINNKTKVSGRPANVALGAWGSVAPSTKSLRQIQHEETQGKASGSAPPVAGAHDEHGHPGKQQQEEEEEEEDDMFWGLPPSKARTRPTKTPGKKENPKEPETPDQKQEDAGAKPSSGPGRRRRKKNKGGSAPGNRGAHAGKKPKKKMQQVDPSLLGFSTKTEGRSLQSAYDASSGD